MIKEIIDETLVQMNEKLYGWGLSRYQLNDASLLAETIVLLAFRDKLINRKEEELLSILNGIGTSGKAAFIHNFVQNLSKNIIEKRLIANYKIALTERLQMNSLSATTIAQATMPEILKSLIRKFSRGNINEENLSRVINNGLPLYSSISEERKKQ
jgi:hypothetical protein